MTDVHEADDIAPEELPVPQPGFTWEGPPSGPTSKLGDDDGGAFSDTPDHVVILEKLVGPNNLRPIAFLERGLQLAAAVAHITIPGVGTGTGFLIGRDVLLTNNHVLPTVSSATQAIVRFNYEDALDGLPREPRIVRCDPGAGFHTSPYTDGVLADHLDYTVVRLAEPVGEDYGAIPLSTDAHVAPPLDVVIIQHPAGEKKQIAIADNELVYADELKCQYLTDTLPGSSGAPVFNDRWELVALHHAGGLYYQPGDPQAHLRNEGVRISAIVADLPGWVVV